MTDFFTLAISEIRRETKEAILIVFDIPDNLKSNFKFIAGQYVTIITQVDSKEVRRAYSICSSPNDKTLQIAVKAVEKGVFSIYANTRLKAGDCLEVSAPEGRFILPTNPSHKKDYLAFAAGSGITPIMAMIKAVLKNEQNSRFVLVFANKTVKDIIFKNTLDDLKKLYPSRFFIEYIFSRVHLKNTLFGRIDEGVINYCLENKYKSFDFDSFFLCGPGAMIKTLKETLMRVGKPSDKIFFELFTTAITESSKGDDFSDAHLTIILDEETHKIKLKAKESILEAALSAEIDAPYSCRGGVCASCMAQLIEGKVTMINNTVLTDEEIESGIILTCQAHPITDKIGVDYDAV